MLYIETLRKSQENVSCHEVFKYIKVRHIKVTIHTPVNRKQAQKKSFGHTRVLWQAQQMMSDPPSPGTVLLLEERRSDNHLKPVKLQTRQPIS